MSINQKQATLHSKKISQFLNNPVIQILNIYYSLMIKKVKNI